MGRKAGQPSKYKPEYCEAIIDYCKDGLTLTCFAAEIGVCRDTVNEWAAVHPEFSDAKKKAQEASERWWLRLGQGLATGRVKGNASVWIFTMKAQFRWREELIVMEKSPYSDITDEEIINAAGRKN